MEPRGLETLPIYVGVAIFDCPQGMVVSHRHLRQMILPKSMFKDVKVFKRMAYTLPL